MTVISYILHFYNLNYTNANTNDWNIEINSPTKLSNVKYLPITENPKYIEIEYLMEKNNLSKIV